MSVEYRAIKETEFDECLDLWDRSFSNTPRSFFKAYFYNDPYFKPEYTRVCDLDGKLVSAVQICEREIHSGKSVLTLGGIANVGTDPQHRGKGYSSKLLLDSQTVMRNSGMDVSILYTGINQFYEKIGWKTIQRRFVSGEISPDITNIKSNDIRNCEWNKDITQLIDIYDDYNNCRSLTNVRSIDYWNTWIANQSNHGAIYKVLVADDRVSGYIQCDFDDQNCWINEIGYSSNSKCVNDLIISAVKESYSAGARKLWSRLPNNSDIDNILSKIIIKPEISYSSGDMYYLINTRSVLDKIHSELKRRILEYDLPGCNLNVHSDDGMHNLVLQGKETANKKELSFDSVSFMSHIFSLRKTESNPDAEYINLIFPDHESAIWGIDHF